jgi:diguanylate cyclase (GGDEF)-like protein
MDGVGEPAASDRQFSGIITRMAVSFLAETEGEETLALVLAEAGLTDFAEQFADDSAWFSYGQVRSLLEAIARVAGKDALQRAATASRLHDESRVEMTQMLQDFGSPGNLLRSMFSADAGPTSFGLATILEYEGKELAPGEWELTQRFLGGFPPFREFCTFSLGLHALQPMLFGLPPGQVDEVRCACDGHPECTFRLRWETTADVTHQKNFFEMRSSLLQVRLETLQRTVMDLVSAPDPEEGLQRVLEAAARSVRAPAYVLSIDRGVPLAQRLYFGGLPESEALAVAETLAQQVGADLFGMIAVEVSSTRGKFGHLGVIEPQSRHFLPQERQLVQSYASLAAAALDSATALEEARRQATTAGTLLDLSSSLTELRSTEEMALNLARAVQSVIDCDQSMVLVHDASSGGLHVAATHGFAESLEHQLAAVTLPATSVQALAGGVAFYPADRIAQFRQEHGVALDDAAMAGASAPMVANDEFIGALVVFVSDRPERLRENSTLGEALRGLSGQAAIGIRNAQLVDQVRHQALHDALTHLPNRTLVLDRLEQALARTKRDGTVAAAMFIDLDGFKDVNDTLGHSAGDRLLVAVADRLRATVRGSDTLGRLGGDEFVVVAEGASLADGPQPIAERILEVMRSPYELEGIDGRLSVTASIGIAMGHRESAGELLRDSDIALYHAKEQGKNCFALYEPEMSQRAVDRMDLEKQVRIAAERQQFFLLYQPFFDLCTGRVIGAEALLRWRHPERGVLDAQDFVGVIEDIGLGAEVGQKVLGEAIRQGSRWHQLGYPIDISVNVSRGQLERGHVASDIAHALAHFGFPTSSFVVEVAEACFDRNLPNVLLELRSIRELGVRVAVDDFGTVSSSLAYLSQFPVDEVKIDRSFIARIDGAEDGPALIHVLVELGRALGLRTLAEGIETTAQVSHLQRERCDGGQGFLLARPLPPEAIEELLAAAAHR